MKRTFLLLISLFILISCGPGPEEQAFVTENFTGDVERTSNVKAVDFILPNLQGEKFQLSSFEGKENVLLVFGATWCVYCIHEIPDLNELYDAYNDKGLKILSVNVGEPKEKVGDFWQRKGAKYDILLDESGMVARDYGVYGIPANFLINKEGMVLMGGHLDVRRVHALMNRE